MLPDFELKVGQIIQWDGSFLTVEIIEFQPESNTFLGVDIVTGFKRLYFVSINGSKSCWILVKDVLDPTRLAEDLID